MSLLQIIVETTPHAWRKRGDKELRPFDEVAQALPVFGKAFMSLDSRNNLRVISAQSGKITGADVLFCSERDARVDIHNILSAALAELVERNNKIDLRPEDAQSTELPSNGLVSALSRALCFVHRARRRRAAASHALPARVLILQASPDKDQQVNASMNCIFAAKSLDVTVDGCTLAPELAAGEAQMLQQAADRTGGALFDCSDPAEALLPQLILAALPGAAERTQWFRSPAPTMVHLGATCFCHRKAVEKTALVCSVCLGVFCALEPTGRCPTCQTEVRSGPPSRPTQGSEADNPIGSKRPRPDPA